jgi:microcin C transport system ATP-binding protein
VPIAVDRAKIVAEAENGKIWFPLQTGRADNWLRESVNDASFSVRAGKLLALSVNPVLAKYWRWR